jgi:hypothetical protein
MNQAQINARRILSTTLTGMAFATIYLSLTATVPTADAAGSQNPPINVIVSNTPLPVTGNIGVNGAVSASQSGTWEVEVAGVPTVESADVTTLIDSFAGTVDGGGAFTSVVSASDISWARSVRVMGNCFGGACANITVRVYTTVGGRSYLLDQYPMQNFLSSTAVYDVIGTNVTVQLLNNNGDSTENIGFALFGRAN